MSSCRDIATVCINCAAYATSVFSIFKSEITVKSSSLAIRELFS